MCNLTVIMSVFNESNIELNNSINSILNQSFSNFLFIIIDDNPHSKRIKRYLLQKSLKDSRIRLVFNNKNKGLVYSLNKAIRKTDTPIIARMDADDIAIKDRLRNQLSFLKSNNLDLTFSNNDIIYKGVLRNNKSKFDFDIVNQKLLKYIFSHYNNIAVHSTWLIKRNVYIELNGYRYITAAEDYDFILRAQIMGFRLGYQSKKLLISRIRSNSISRTNVLYQFINSKILQRYCINYKYKRIISLSMLHKISLKIMTPKLVRKFNSFLCAMHNFKYHLRLKDLFKSLYLLFISLVNFEYLLMRLDRPYKKFKVYEKKKFIDK